MQVNRRKGVTAIKLTAHERARIDKAMEVLEDLVRCPSEHSEAAEKARDAMEALYLPLFPPADAPKE